MFVLTIAAAGFIGLAALLATAWVSLPRGAEPPPAAVVTLTGRPTWPATAYYDGANYAYGVEGRYWEGLHWYDMKTGYRASPTARQALNRALDRAWQTQAAARRLAAMRDLGGGQ